MLQTLARLPRRIANCDGPFGAIPQVFSGMTARCGVTTTTQGCCGGRQQQNLRGAPAGFWGHGAKTITSIDCHAAGEPARVIVAGAPEVKGVTMMEKRVELMEVCCPCLDDWRPQRNDQHAKHNHLHTRSR